MLRVYVILALFLCGPTYADETPQERAANLRIAAGKSLANAMEQDKQAKPLEDKRDALRKENKDYYDPQIKDRTNYMNTQADEEEKPDLKKEIQNLQDKRDANEKEAERLDGLAKLRRAEQAQAMKDYAEKMAQADQLTNGTPSGPPGAPASKGGGMPLIPPPPSGGGDKGNDSGGNDQPKPPTVATPGPMPSPSAAPQANAQVMSDKDFQAAIDAIKAGKSSDASTLKNQQAIAALTQQNADLAAQTAAAQKEAAALRADESLKEMQKVPAARSTGAMMASTGSTGAKASSSPFDLSPKGGTGAPSMTGEHSGATMNALQVAPKQQASNRLLASATGTAPSGSQLSLTAVTPTAEPAMRNGITVKKTSGPVYGLRTTSGTTVNYKTMTVPQGLQSTMNTRIAVVGGSTPQNHTPPQRVAVQSTTKPATSTSDGYAHRRNTQLLKAHIVIQ